MCGLLVETIDPSAAKIKPCKRARQEMSMGTKCSADYLGGGRLRIKSDVLARLQNELEGRLAEGNFLEDRDCHGPSIVSPDETVIMTFWWYGEGAANSYDTLVEKILPHTLGFADVLFTWNGGGTPSGLRIEDGKVTECDVVMALEPKKAA